MADRKVLIKYFPKNFDPKLLVKRGRGKDKLMNVRNMLPMSLRCNVCHNYLYIGTKFNMRMEICNEETYLGIKVFRFYLKCTYCYNDICFKTDPKNHDYIVEDGGTRNYEPLKDAEQAQKLMKKMQKEEKQGNSMKFLENRTYDSKREMELMEALDDIKNLNKRRALIDPQDLLNNMIVEEQENQKLTEEQEDHIDNMFEELRKKKLLETQEGASRPLLESNYRMAQNQQQEGDESKLKLEFELSCQARPLSSIVSSEQEVKVQSHQQQHKQQPSNSEQLKQLSNLEQPSKQVESAIMRIHAIQKGGLLNLQEKNSETKKFTIPKRKVPKAKVIKPQSKQPHNNSNQCS